MSQLAVCMVSAQGARSPRNLSLCALALHLSALGIVIHLSRAVLGPQYRAAALVVLTELGKLIVAGALALNEARGRTVTRRTRRCRPTRTRAMRAHLGARGGRRSARSRRRCSRRAGSGCCCPRSCSSSRTISHTSGSAICRCPRFVLSRLKVRLPLASRRLTAQIPTTAVFSVLLLSRRLERRQWASSEVLAPGVAAVQLTSAAARPAASAPAVFKAVAARMIHRLPQLVTKDPIVGIAAVVIQAISSAFASVFFENQLKQSTGTTSASGSSV